MRAVGACPRRGSREASAGDATDATEATPSWRYCVAVGGFAVFLVARVLLVWAAATLAAYWVDGYAWSEALVLNHFARIW
jgi:hypothetical protein